jgi:hypothetical protein
MKEEAAKHHDIAASAMQTTTFYQPILASTFTISPRKNPTNTELNHKNPKIAYKSP